MLINSENIIHSTKLTSKDELLIGKDYWNFICNDEYGFDIIFIIIFDQYI